MKFPSFFSQQDVAKTSFKGSNAPKGGEKYNAALELANSLPKTEGKQNELERLAAMARMTV